MCHPSISKSPVSFSSLLLSVFIWKNESRTNCAVRWPCLFQLILDAWLTNAFIPADFLEGATGSKRHRKQARYRLFHPSWAGGQAAVNVSNVAVGSDTEVAVSRTLSLMPASIFLLSNSRGEPRVRPKPAPCGDVSRATAPRLPAHPFLFRLCVSFGITQAHTHTQTPTLYRLNVSPYLKAPHAACDMIYSPECVRH